jgi:GDSL-like Lipase/Acylhydrolase family
MATLVKMNSEERLDTLERRMSEFEQRVSRVEARLGLSKAGGGQIEDRLDRMEKVAGASFSEVVVAGKGKATRKMEQAARSQVYLREGCSSMVVPKPRVTQEPKPQNGVNMKEGTVLVFGSSMARGVGNHLHADNELFGKLDFGGARIEDIEEKVKIVGDKPESHVVFMVGTNNLVNDYPETIMDKYEKLIEAIKDRCYRKVSIVGILPRADYWMSSDRQEYIDCKRFAVNMDLKELCVENDIEFVDIDIDTRRMLDRKGLHLNYRGQEVVAKKIFTHCQQFLN